jgi:16S rRNA (adenine1518-N6/adenine1519-N6)-dimethyltransferase
MSSKKRPENQSKPKAVKSSAAQRPKKRFGQHFLVSKRVIRDIVERLEPFQGLLEIGPGLGALTGPLSDKHQLTALEIDPSVMETLSLAAPKARVLVQDALTADISGLLEELPAPVGIVSNMPYNITGPLLDRILNCRPQIEIAVLMMQKEVAAKIMAEVGSRARGALSVVMQASFQISKVCDVPPGSFRPPPKVDSTVLQLVPSTSFADDSVVRIVKAGFRNPRKSLVNNLTALYSREEASDRVARAGLSPTVRPHQVSWSEWQALAR